MGFYYCFCFNNSDICYNLQDNLSLSLLSSLLVFFLNQLFSQSCKFYIFEQFLDGRTIFPKFSNKSYIS